MIGGVLIALGSWRWVFLVNIPLVIVALIADSRVLPRTRRTRHSLDVPGALFITASVVSLTAAIIQAPTWGIRSLTFWFVVAFGLATATGFVVRQRTAPEPMVQLRWFRERTLTIPTLVAGGLFFAMTGASFVLMLYLQLVVGYTALEAGLAILPAVATTTAVAPCVGSVTARIGPRTLMVAGMLSLCAGIAWFATANAEG